MWEVHRLTLKKKKEDKFVFPFPSQSEVLPPETRLREWRRMCTHTLTELTSPYTVTCFPFRNVHISPSINSYYANVASSHNRRI